MASSYFFLQAQKNERNSNFLTALETYADASKRQIFVLDRPLGDGKYRYTYEDAFVVLSPDFKITFIDFGDSPEFDDYVFDFVEDLGSISDKFRYKSIIGRPREWKDRIIEQVKYDTSFDNIATFLEPLRLTDGGEKKKCELLISLLTGSINDIDKVKGNVPDNILDKIKQKILLFDGDQTRFVYQKIDKPSITIQGLSGTGKTELLLHKLKELYVGQPDSKLMFTCHNHVLSDSLRKRIPDFFTFMKVEEQIKWEERLWCVNAWGSQSDPDSGAYRYICDYYGLTFHRFSPTMSFDRACQIALAEHTSLATAKDNFAFDYMLVDESQDFPDSFLELCSAVTKNTVFVAGDIFQSIFDSQKIDSIAPDFLLSKCYRTDPRTLMFSHALSMGLFEKQKLQWLEDSEWQKCGYIVDNSENGVYKLTREPLRRFEDLETSETSSVELFALKLGESIDQRVVGILKSIREENPTVLADDIGIVFLGNGKEVYSVADALAYQIPREFGWTVNKAYESKQKVKDSIFITNKNNVKGLEFPFVICIAGNVGASHQYRNALYMTMTRSFIKSYLVLSAESNAAILPVLRSGLDVIEKTGTMIVAEPTEDEKKRIKTTIEGSIKTVSFYDFVYSIFDELAILPIYRKQLFDATKMIVGETFDHDSVADTVRFAYKKMSGVKV